MTPVQLRAWRRRKRSSRASKRTDKMKGAAHRAAPFVVSTMGTLLNFFAISMVGLIIYVIYYVAKTKEKNSENIEHLLSIPRNDLDMRLSFLHQISGKSATSYARDRALSKAVEYLQVHINDPQMHDAFLHYVKTAILEPQAKRSCYSRVFSVFSRHHQSIEPSARRFFVDVARWAYAGSRPDGRLTIYDEQAIQNDLATLAKN